MAKRRSKKRTHVGANNPATSADVKGHADPRNPKSMVLRMGAGNVGPSVSQLAMDVRRVMEPGTASRLKERKANRLRDYVTMCGPLGVTHLMLFSRSEAGNVSLRLAAAPRGPTFHFQVEKYSLCKDVQRAQRRPKKGGRMEYTTPPLLVMNKFTSPTSNAKTKVPRHLETTLTSAFQGLLPPINPQVTPPSSIRRVLLLNREETPEGPNEDFVLNFRHYAITTKRVGLSKPLQRLDAAERLLHSKKTGKGGLPNLGKLTDIAQYMTGGDDGNGYMTDGTSGSEAETDAEVEVVETAPRRVLSSKARAASQAAATVAEVEGNDADRKVEKRGVKLVELGPRMRLRLLKVEEGLDAGKVLWHAYKQKSLEEVREMDKQWEQKNREREARKKQQKANVEKKKQAKAEAKKSGKGCEEGEEDHEHDDLDEMDVDDMDSNVFDYDGEGFEGFESGDKNNEE